MKTNGPERSGATTKHANDAKAERLLPHVRRERPDLEEMRQVYRAAGRWLAAHGERICGTTARFHLAAKGRAA